METADDVLVRHRLLEIFRYPVLHRLEIEVSHRFLRWMQTFSVDFAERERSRPQVSKKRPSAAAVSCFIHLVGCKPEALNATTIIIVLDLVWLWSHSGIDLFAAGQCFLQLRGSGCFDVGNYGGIWGPIESNLLRTARPMRFSMIEALQEAVNIISHSILY